MRIISGNLSGRLLVSPSGNKTHPMSEKIRGALFSVLGDIEGLSLLDAFSGSGAIGLEAFSRGAQDIVLVEKDKSAQEIIDKNIRLLNVKDKVKLIHANVSSWSSNNPSSKYDLVVLDPPYNEVKEPLLIKLSRHTKVNGILVLSLPPDSDFDLNDDFEMLKRKKYGDSSLVFYKRIR